MATVMSLSEFVRKFDECIGRVAKQQKSFVLTDGQVPVAEVRPPRPTTTGKDLAEAFRSLPRLTAAEAADFAHDLEEIQRAAALDRGRDPWGS